MLDRPARRGDVKPNDKQAPKPVGRRRRRIRRALILLAVLALSPSLVLAHPRARAAARLTRGFRAHPQDSRVYYEAGAEDYAQQIAEALPDAVTRVEDCQAKPFASDFRVYICASHESFARHLAEDATGLVRGMALARDIWVSPKAFAFFGRDTHRQTVAHELSHLHGTQHLGWWRGRKHVPTWFAEGLADWVAGTGYERVSREEALAALSRGRRLVPDSSGRAPIPKAPQDYGLSWPMLHAQSRMFVEYLHGRDEESFRQFVAAVLDGLTLDAAFTEHFGDTVSGLWQDFLESLEAPAEGRAAPRTPEPPAPASLTPPPSPAP